MNITFCQTFSSSISETFSCQYDEDASFCQVAGRVSLLILTLLGVGLFYHLAVACCRSGKDNDDVPYFEVRGNRIDEQNPGRNGRPPGLNIVGNARNVMIQDGEMWINGRRVGDGNEQRQPREVLIRNDEGGMATISNGNNIFSCGNGFSVSITNNSLKCEAGGSGTVKKVNNLVTITVNAGRMISLECDNGNIKVDGIARQQPQIAIQGQIQVISHSVGKVQVRI